MKFMMFIKHPADYDIKNVPQALFGAMGEFIEQSAKKGIFLDGAGLQPLSKATRVRLSKGKIKVSDGPFAEAKEVIGGYAICELATYDEAVAFTKEFMELHRTHWPEFEGEAELRPFEEQQG